MSTQNSFSEVGQRWSGWARIIGTIIAFVVFILGGGFIYNEVWKAPVLNYTLLPEYDLGDQVFSGIVIQNRGRVPLTDVRIIMAELGDTIEALNIPGAHEPVDVVEGGEGGTELHLLMPQLSTGTSLPVYLLTEGPLTLGDNSLLVTSNETLGILSGNEADGSAFLLTVVSLAVTGVNIGLAVSIYLGQRRNIELSDTVNNLLEELGEQTGKLHERRLQLEEVRRELEAKMEEFERGLDILRSEDDGSDS